jgi:hypothetical protein
MKPLRLAFFAAFCLSAAGLASAAPELGFAGMEIYKLDWDTHSPRIADVNGDGLNDIVVVNNARARIECLLQRADPSAPMPEEELGVNEVPDDRRFRRRPLMTEKKVFCIALGDLNGDGRADLAYYGDPRELIVQYQDARGEWEARRRFDIRDGATVPYGIEAADLNGDGRADLALMADDGIYFLYQDEEGHLQAPVKDAGLPQGALGMAARDLDGDGRMDLVFITSRDDAPFCFRLQTADGGLGPEIGCRVPAMRSVAMRDVNGDGRMEIAVVQQLLARLVVYEMTNECAPGALLEGALERYALRAGASRRAPALAVGPFLTPKGPDLLVSDPDAAEIVLYMPAGEGIWRRQDSFPTLQGVTDVAPFDADGDGRAEALLLSPDEPMLGLARFDAHGLLQFPNALPITGKPVCMAVGDLNGDGQPEVVCGAVDGGRLIHILAKEADGFVVRKTITLKDPKTDPDGLLITDVNHDGIADILVFFPYQEMRVLKGTPEGEYADVSSGPEYGAGLVRGLRRKAVALGDVDGDGRDELLITSKNFARALKMDEADRLKVVEQFNGRSAQSVISSVALADLDGDGVVEVILADSGQRCLTALKRTDAGGYEIAENVDVGDLNLNALLPLPPAADGKPALLLLGGNDFRVLRPGAPRVALREFASYETPVRNGRLQLVEMADLIGDGRTEFIVTETTESLMEILELEEDLSIRRVLSWPVFESRVFPGGDEPGGSEPRQFEVGDVTHDGKPDLVLLVHDRVLVYVSGEAR